MDPYDLGDPALSRPIDATPPAPASPNAYDDVEPRPPGPPGPPSPPGALLTDPAPPVVVKDLNPSPDKEALKQQELQLQKQDEVKDAKQEPEPITVTEPPAMPAHRSRCVACGCARVCCVRNFVFLWVVLFILVQAGPLAVLILDLLSIKSEGATISRYIAELDMEPAVCRVQGYFIEDFRSCPCLKGDTSCNKVIKDYGCMRVMVSVYSYNKTGAIAEGLFMWKSEREYVLDTVEPKCFNLDICTIDASRPWYEYRNETHLDEVVLQEKQRREDGFFVCHYRPGANADDDGSKGGGGASGKDNGVVLMQMNTTLWDLLLWFALPLGGIALCWFMVCVCLCWYCCPRGQWRSGGGRAKSREASEAEEAGESRYLMPYND